MKYTVTTQKTLAYINPNGEIKTAQRFEKLDIKVRAFIVHVLEFKHRNREYNVTIFDADRYAIQEVMKTYPNIPLTFYQRELNAVFLAENPTEQNKERIQKLKCGLENCL